MKSKILRKVLSFSMVVLMVIPMFAFLPYNLKANAEEKCITYVPVAQDKMLRECFPDDEFASYVYYSILDKHNAIPNNYKLTADDVRAIKSTKRIDFYYAETLYDLTGIQNFDSLERLDCSGTSITNLDLSQNKKLRVLNCSCTGITSLSLSQNTKLNDLNCSCTGILDLNLSKNKELNILNCSHTSVRNLDLSNNTKLSDLNCKCTNISNLDTTHNTKLKILIAQIPEWKV